MARTLARLQVDSIVAGSKSGPSSRHAPLQQMSVHGDMFCGWCCSSCNGRLIAQPRYELSRDIHRAQDWLVLQSLSCTCKCSTGLDPVDLHVAVSAIVVRL